MDNIFEYATRNKLRFSSTKGDLTVEQLWDVPLRSKEGDVANANFNLNNIAQRASAALKELDAENFVETKRTPAHTIAELRFEVVKSIIDTKKNEEEAAKKRAENKQKKDKLLAILAEKQDGALSAMSVKELQRQIDALED